MYNLLRKKIAGVRQLLTIVLLASSTTAFSQQELYLPNHDDKKYYLGIGVIYNMSRFQMHHDPSFLSSDTVLAINPENAGGIGLAGIHTLRLSNRFEVRASFPQ